MKKRKQINLLAILILLLVILNYPFLDNLVKEIFFSGDYVIVDRVIDGDTVVISNESTRLLGINSPERGEIYYDEASVFLEEMVLNQSVRFKYGKDKKDMYGRLLAYLFSEEKNVNLELVKQGFANFYFPSGKDKYYEDFKEAWEDCIKENKNLCEKSNNNCAECIVLENFGYNKDVILKNVCGFDCDLSEFTIKDEGRKVFVFPEFVLEKNKQVEIKVNEGENTETTLFWSDEDYVWTRTGDTFFLRDNSGKLILWETY